MHTHIEIGVGKYIEENFSKAKSNILISTPEISLTLSKKLITYLQNEINIKIILSEAANNESKESINLLNKYQKENNHGILEIKVVDSKQAALIHAKIYIIDEKIAIIGSANLTENGFYNFVEFIEIFKEKNYVNIIREDFNKLWKLFE